MCKATSALVAEAKIPIYYRLPCKTACRHRVKTRNGIHSSPLFCSRRYRFSANRRRLATTLCLLLASVVVLALLLWQSVGRHARPNNLAASATQHHSAAIQNGSALSSTIDGASNGSGSVGGASSADGSVAGRLKQRWRIEGTGSLGILPGSPAGIRLAGARQHGTLHEQLQQQQDHQKQQELGHRIPAGRISAAAAAIA